MVARLSSFASDVRSTILTGLTTATATAISATDTVLAALGKVQAQIAAVPPTPLKNRLFNGSMEVATRGTSSLAVPTNGSAPFAPGTYTLDRWNLQSASQAGTVSQVAVSGQSFRYALQYVATFPANGSFYVLQRLEAADLNDLAGQTVTFSFYAGVSSAAASATVTAQYATTSSTDNWSSTGTQSNAQFGSGNTFSLTTTLTRYSATVTLPSTITTGFAVLLYFASNVSSSTAATFQLSGCQLELGSSATKLEKMPIGFEVTRCQRYYQSIYLTLGSYSGGASAVTTMQVILSPPLRVTPTVTNNGVTYGNASAASVGGVTPGSASSSVTASAAGNCYAYGTFNFSAEL